MGDAGKLPIEVADAFIDTVVEEATSLPMVTVRRMNGPTGRTDELRVADRTMRAAVEGTAPTPSDSVSIVKRSLTTVETILAEDITLTFLEDNIEKGNVESHIASLLARKWGTQMNDLAWNGDETTGSFLVINNGWIVLMLADSDVNDVDLSTGAATAKAALNKTLRGMPDRFRALGDLTYFVPVNFAQTYSDEFADRETNAGDQVFTNGFPNLRYFGRPVIPETHLFEATGTAQSADKLVLAPKSNLVFGIQRSFTVDAEWQPRKRVVEYTMTARTDYEYGSGEPMVLGDAIVAGLL